MEHNNKPAPGDVNIFGRKPVQLKILALIVITNYKKTKMN